MFTPTHRHYEGGLYKRHNIPATVASDVVEGDRVYIYENALGQLFVRKDTDFDATVEGLGGPVPRFQQLP